MTATTSPTGSAVPAARSLASVEIGTRRSLRTTLANALIITRREVRDSFRDWRILAPIVILTFAFPFLAQFVAGRFLSFVTDYGAQIIGERTIPFLLMIVGFFPISISLVIALETFVGEKERRSLEPLLSTPLTNTELYIGKTLAAMIPPLVSSFGGMMVYLASLVYSDIWRPQPLLVVQIIVLTTVQALVMVTGAVVVSSQTTSTRAANLLASFIIIPMTFIIQGESAIMFLAPDADSPTGIGALWAIIVGMCVTVVLLLRVGNSVFNREELLGRTIDQVNLKALFSRVWRWTIAVDDRATPARHLLDWYTRGMAYTFRRLRTPALIVVATFAFFFAWGFALGQTPEWRLPLLQDPRVSNTEFLSANLNLFTAEGPGWIMGNNARLLLGATLLGMFSFGTAALILTPAVFFVLGFTLSQVVAAGFDPGFFAPAILTHGVVEIPIIIIATAMAFRLGAVMTRPPAGWTVGQALMAAIGDTIKLWVGVILPGLFIAACIEAYITPLVLARFLGI